MRFSEIGSLVLGLTAAVALFLSVSVREAHEGIIHLQVAQAADRRVSVTSDLAATQSYYLADREDDPVLVQLENDYMSQLGWQPVTTRRVRVLMARNEAEEAAAFRQFED